MINKGLFAALEREVKLDKLGDILQILEKHVDFAAVAKAINQVDPRPSKERGGRPPSRLKSWCKQWFCNSLTV